MSRRFWKVLEDGSEPLNWWERILVWLFVPCRCPECEEVLGHLEALFCLPRVPLSQYERTLSMSLSCINPWVYQGDPGNPPEFESDNSADCAQCAYIIDLDDEPYLKLDNGDYLCHDCREMCECGEWVTDMDKAVVLRDPITGHRELCHPECAAGIWMEVAHA